MLGAQRIAVSLWRRPPEVKPRRVLKVALALVLVLAAIKVLASGGSAVGLLIAVLDRVRSMGAWGVPALFACEAFAFLTLLPISPIHIGIGFLYGPWVGAVLAWSAYAIGCVPPFMLARIPCLAARLAVLRRRTDVLDGVFAAVELEPFKLIVCLRLSPVLPSTLNSYLLGLTNVSLRAYFLGSLVGSAPNVCAYVYLGTLLDSLADSASLPLSAVECSCSISTTARPCGTGEASHTHGLRAILQVTAAPFDASRVHEQLPLGASGARRSHGRCY